MFLTAAQSFLALIIIMDLKFSWRGAVLLAVLFITQLMLPYATVRYAYAIAYMVIAIVMLINSRVLRNGIRHTFRMLWRAPIVREEDSWR